MSENLASYSAFPSIDDDPLTEIGVILMGLDDQRLLAGLGIAESVDEPSIATLLVDQARHGVLESASLSDLVERGSDRWRVVRPTLMKSRGEAMISGALRQVWTEAFRVVAECEVDWTNTTEVTYLTACWLRDPQRY